MFRNTRSISGVYSTIVNFTVIDFLRRSQKLSILNQIKCQQQNNENEKHLLFPVHHKHKNDNHLVIQEELDNVYGLNIEQIILNSYKMAVTLIKPLNMVSSLKQHDIFEIDSLSKYAFNQLNTKSKMNDNSRIFMTNVENSSNSEPGSDADNENNDNIEDDSESLDESLDDEEENLNSIKNDFHGINIRDKINMEQEDCYFKININDTVKSMHKQTACWTLTKENGKISTDRLSRVIQASKK